MVRRTDGMDSLNIHDIKNGRLTHEATQRRPSHRSNPRGGCGWPHPGWWLPPRRWASNGRGGGGGEDDGGVGVNVGVDGWGDACRGNEPPQRKMPPSQR